MIKEPNSKYSSKGAEKIIKSQIYQYSKWKTAINNTTKSTTFTPPTQGDFAKPENPGISKRRRVRGPMKSGLAEITKVLDSAVTEAVFATPLENETEPEASISAKTSHIFVRALSASSTDLNGSLLNTIKPRWIILYGPDMSFIRKIEVSRFNKVYNALNPDTPVKVFLMVYNNSVEEQQFLTSLRREKEAFEKLILEKGVMQI